MTTDNSTIKLWERTFPLLAIAIMLALFVAAIAASALDEEELNDKYPGATGGAAQLAHLLKARAAQPKNEYLKVTRSVDIRQGYDNNVDLSPDRHKDGYLQGFGNLSVNYEFTEDFTLKTSSDIFEIVYYKYNVDNIVDVTPKVGFTWQLVPEKLIWKTAAMFDYLYYPNRKESSYAGLEVDTSLRHKFAKNFSHELEYNHIARWYPDKMIPGDTGARVNEERSDVRNVLKYKITGLFVRRMIISARVEAQNNDSNYIYQKYYDYWVYRVRPTAMYFFTGKLYASASYSYKFKDYTDRRRTVDSSKTVNERLHTYNIAFYYDLTKTLTLDVTYTYNENYSNDPFNRYSGNTISLGAYCTF